MSRTIGCIGCGNMGGAILAGFADRLGDKGYSFCGYNRTPERMRPLADKGVRVMPDVLETARKSDVLLLAVKPYQVAAVLEEMRPALDGGKVLVSVAAGVSLKSCARPWAGSAGGPLHAQYPGAGGGGGFCPLL